MGVDVADLERALVGLPGAGCEAGDHPARDPDHPEHQPHRAGELLAVTGAVLEQERVERVGVAEHVRVVGVLPAQVVLDRADRRVRGLCPGRPRTREPIGVGVRRGQHPRLRVGVACPPERHRDGVPGRERARQTDRRRVPEALRGIARGRLAQLARRRARDIGGDRVLGAADHRAAEVGQRPVRAPARRREPAGGHRGPGRGHERALEAVHLEAHRRQPFGMATAQDALRRLVAGLALDHGERIRRLRALPRESVEAVEHARLPVQRGLAVDGEHRRPLARPVERAVGVIPLEADVGRAAEDVPGLVVEQRTGVEPGRDREGDDTGGDRERERLGALRAAEPGDPEPARRERQQQHAEDQIGPGAVEADGDRVGDHQDGERDEPPALAAATGPERHGGGHGDRGRSGEDHGQPDPRVASPIRKVDLLDPLDPRADPGGELAPVRRQQQPRLESGERQRRRQGDESDRPRGEPDAASDGRDGSRRGAGRSRRHRPRSAPAAAAPAAGR